MYFNNGALLFSLLATAALASPTARQQKRQDVTAIESYAQLTISAGTAGNAAAEATAKLAGLPTDLASTTADQLSTLQTNRECAEDAEVNSGGYDDAVAAATGDAATALQNGKIKNKVLKLTLEVQGLLIEQAQGKDVSSDLTTEQGKLSTNIALDKAAAGQASTAIDFTC